MTTRSKQHVQRAMLESLESRTLLSANISLYGPAGYTAPIANGTTTTSTGTGTVFGGGANMTRHYYILNESPDNTSLHLTGRLPVTITGDTNAFAIVTQPTLSTIPSTSNGNVAAGQYTYFQVILVAIDAGAIHNATIHIASDDPNKPDATFAISGTVPTPTTTITTNVAGTGRGAAVQDIVTVNYSGYLVSNGTMFDSSLKPGGSPFTVQIGISSVIEGWTKGLVGIKAGESRTLLIPSAEGYGTTGSSSGGIPANADLRFTVTALRIVSSNFLPKLYQDILGRAPDNDGLNSWISKLTDSTSPLTPAQVTAGFINSLEYRTNRIQSLYQTVLSRSADTGGLNSWLAYLAAGNTVEQMQSQFYGSQEFALKHGNTTTGVITGLYQVLLHRDPDPSGLASWTSQVNSGSTIAQVAYKIIRAPEGLTTSVTRIYQLYLHRNPDSSGLAHWSALLGQTGKSETDIVSGIMSASEYFNS